jgi:uncharacterized protein YcfJ
MSPPEHLHKEFIMTTHIHTTHLALRPVESTAKSTQTDVVFQTHIPVDHHDPLSGQPSIHPIGTTVGTAMGAAAGALVGAMIGAAVGPIGAAVGATVGAIAAAFAGGAAGRHVTELLYPSTEDRYWRTCYIRRPYISPGTPYENIRPAYLFGVEMRKVHLEKTWDQAEPFIHSAWEESLDLRSLPWSIAQPAILDAWDKLTPRDPDL